MERYFPEPQSQHRKPLTWALDAAHEAFKTWGKASATLRSNLLLKMAQVIEDNLEFYKLLIPLTMEMSSRELRRLITGFSLPLSTST